MPCAENSSRYISGYKTPGRDWLLLNTFPVICTTVLSICLINVMCVYCCCTRRINKKTVLRKDKLLVTTIVHDQRDRIHCHYYSTVS